MISTRSRSLMALLLTLAIGLFLGAMIGGRLAARRMDSLRSMIHPEAMKNMMLHHIRPAPEQRAELDSILDVHASNSSRMILEHRLLMKDQLDSLMQQLKPQLDEDQWERLQRGLAPGRRGPEGRPPGFGPGQGRGRHGPRGEARRQAQQKPQEP